jgi:hypothetical protein
MTAARMLSSEELTAGLAYIRCSPADAGPVELIVRRPQPGERELVPEAELDLVVGLVGDNWKTRGCRLTADGSAHPDMQLTLMNARAVALIAGARERWPLAGDQLYIDMDLSQGNLPAGTRLRLGSAMVEITDQPHTGCKQFAARFGKEAVAFVNSPAGKQLRLRGINAKIIEPGMVRTGDLVTKL